MAWVSGVFLLLATIAMGFTGQLLRWDANGVWSTVVAAQMVGRVPLIGKDLAHFMLGGTTIGGQTLSRFYAYHVFVLPAIIFLFVGYHLMLVLHNGISEPPKAGRLVDPKTYRQWYADMLKKKGVPFWPNAAWRDVTFSTAVVVIIILLAIFVGPPQLTKPPDPASIGAAPRPDWYLLWIFAIMALMPRSIESYAMFLGPLLVVVILFILPFISRKGERSPIRRPWAIFGTLCVVVAILSFWAAGKAANWSPDFETKPLSASVINSSNAEVQEGAHLFYIRGCQFCHRIEGHGGLKGPDLSSIGGTLTVQEMKIRIVNGGKEMPGYGSILSKKELEEIIAFLETRK
jgi:ubiquinol-cytochrome c reductase cytochrome b subunit